MTNATNVFQSPQPPIQLPLRARYSREQMRLYFFPYSERPIKELERELWRWTALAAGVGVLALLLFIWLARSASSSSNTATIWFWALLILAIGIIVIAVMFEKKINPIKKKLEYERSELAKEQDDMQTNPPPSEEEFEMWINAISEENYNKAPKKLQLPEQPGKHFGDLYIRAFASPSQKNPPSPWDTKAAKIWAPRLRKRHYSINIFTRLFVLEDYIAIYTDTFNVRDPRSTQEVCEHCFHQHVSYVSLNVQSETVEGIPGQLTTVLSHQISIALDSGHEVKKDVASAIFKKRVRDQNGHYSYSEDTTDTDKVHKGLLEVLNDHKKSMLRSINEQG